MCPSSAEKRRRPNQWLLIIAVSLLLPAAFVLGYGAYSFHALFAVRYEEEIVVSSPDTRYTLIIRPWSGWDSSGAVFYCRTGSGIPENKIGSMAAAGHNHPFRDGHYRVIWDNTAVTVLYWNRSEEDGITDLSQWETVTFHLQT